MDLERVFMTHHTSDEYSKERLAHSFYATSWAFVHMCLFAMIRDLKSLFEFHRRPEDAANLRELFRKHFDMSYDEMEEKFYDMSEVEDTIIIDSNSVKNSIFQKSLEFNK